MKPTKILIITVTESKAILPKLSLKNVRTLVKTPFSLSSEKNSVIDDMVDSLSINGRWSNKEDKLSVRFLTILSRFSSNDSMLEIKLGTIAQTTNERIAIKIM